ncbi:MAG TPA: hypothetical protein VK403_01835 [Allosphingosinicella sp.]|nr:hypothetical protein [Allosphingosinicella sp.]
MSEHTLTSYGAVSDARELRDAVIVTDTNILTTASAPFAAGDVGKAIVIAGAGASGAKLRTAIATYVSPTEVILVDSAATTVAATGMVFGTDCSAALQAGLNHIADTGGGTLIVDGLFFLTSPVSAEFGDESASLVARLVGTGTDSSIWIGTADGDDSISLTSAGVEFNEVNFIGVPDALTEARRLLNLSALSAVFHRCGFYGIFAQEAVIYASHSNLHTRECLFGGSFVGGGYVNSVIENKNWIGFRDEHSEFIDYGHFQERLYGKSGHSGTLGWVRADTPVGNKGARGESVFNLRGTRLDEGALYGIVAKPTTGTIAHVHLSGLRQNVTPAETGRGVHCHGVESVVMERCWQGWADSPVLVGHFQDCGTVLIDSLKLSDSVNSLAATNVASLTLKDTSGVTTFAFSNVNFHPVTSRYGNLALIKDGGIADADFVSPPAVGTLAFDRTSNRLYIKRVTSGGWIYFDMSGGDPMGPELVVNGTFDNGTTGWSAANSAALSVVDGALRVTNGAIYGRAYQAIPVAIGQQYQVSVSIVGGNAGRLSRVGSSQVQGNYAVFTGTGGTATFTATSATCYIALMLDSEVVGRYADFDNVTLKAV